MGDGRWAMGDGRWAMGDGQASAKAGSVVRAPAWPSQCAVFHLCNPKPMHMTQFLQWLGPDGFGYEIQTVEYKKWRLSLLLAISKRQQKLQQKEKGGASASASPSAADSKAGAGAGAGAAARVKGKSRRAGGSGGGSGSARRPIGIGGGVSLEELEPSAGGGGDEDDGKLDEPNALEPLVSALAEDAQDMGSQENMPKMDPAFTMSVLKQVLYFVALPSRSLALHRAHSSLVLMHSQTGGPVCPPVTGDLLDIYFQFYVASGFLAPP
jgi:hypothetical protein